MRIPLAALALVALSATSAAAQRQALPVHGITADLPVPETGKWQTGGRVDLNVGRATSEIELLGDAGAVMTLSVSLETDGCKAHLPGEPGRPAQELAPELSGEVALQSGGLTVCSAHASGRVLVIGAAPGPGWSEPAPAELASEPSREDQSAGASFAASAVPALVALQKAFAEPNLIDTVPGADDSVEITGRPEPPINLQRSGLHWTPPGDGSVWALRGADADSNEDDLVRLAPALPTMSVSVAAIGLSSPDAPAVCTAILDSRRANQSGSAERRFERPLPDYHPTGIEWRQGEAHRLTLCGYSRHNQIVTVTLTSDRRVDDLAAHRGILTSLVEASGEKGSDILRRLEDVQPEPGGGWIERYVADIGYQSHLAYAGESDDFGDAAPILSVGFAAHLTVGTWIGYSGGVDLSIGSTFGSSFAYDLRVAPLGVAFFAGPLALGARWYGRLDGLTDRIDRGFSAPIEIFADAGRVMGGVELYPLGGPSRSDESPSSTAPFGNELGAILLLRTGTLDGETRNLHIGLTYREVVGARMGGVIIGFSHAGLE